MLRPLFLRCICEEVSGSRVCGLLMMVSRFKSRHLQVMELSSSSGLQSRHDVVDSEQ